MKITVDVLRVMKLTYLLLVITFVHVSATTYGQEVTLKEAGTPLGQVFRKIQKQTGYAIVYDADAVAPYRVQVDLKAAKLDVAIRACLQGLPLDYKIVDKNILIKTAKQTTSSTRGTAVLSTSTTVRQDSLVKVSGTVTDSTGVRLVGVTVRVADHRIQTMTDNSGRFELENVPRGTMLEISYIGYKTTQVQAIPLVFVKLGQNTESMKEVVVTGLFERKKESFTGSTTTFTQKELLEVGNLNVIRSLSNLDPSFRMVENLQLGSDPNMLGEVQMRGQSGLPDLNNEYGANPNLPLFILDGFETDMQRIKDLDIYLVKSITLLKDAASKAVYGSRAANGVVVVETIRPAAGKTQVTYNYNLNVELPDLTSYNLANSAQKLEIEMLTDRGLRDFGGAVNSNLERLRQYDAKLQEVLRGVDTYWLSQPLRNGFGQRHSLTLGGGRDELQYSVELGYNNIKGVMIGSDRYVYNAGIQLTYRKNNLSVNNIFRLSSSRGENSPYGSFQQFANQNPYIRLRDSTGNYSFESPMYNGTVGVKDYTTQTNIVNNTDVVWTIKPFLRLNGRLGLIRTNDVSDVFLPASHNSFPRARTSQTYDPNSILRGSYTKGDAVQNRMNTTVTMNFNKAFDKSTVYANVGIDANSIIRENYGFKVVGFPNANLDFPAAAVQYAPNSRLSGTENTTRDAGFFTAVNYAYDDRYLADVSWRKNRSSQLGSENPTEVFWSAGLGWNIHKEAFMKDSEFFNSLRLTANTGYSGSQPVSAYLGYPVYRYQLDNMYYGQYSVELVGMANPMLEAQRKQDHNISLNTTLLNNKLNIGVDYYIANTDGLLIDLNLPTSTGFNSFKANQGKVENRGVDARVNYQIYKNTQRDAFVSFYFTMGHNTNKLKELSNTLIALTSSQDTIVSSALKRRFEVGRSVNTIWAVPSLGIDPATGKEVFEKKDGSVTYDWDAADQVAAGDAIAKLYGNFGFSVRYQGWQLNTSFAYNIGGDKYNTTLVDRVENINTAHNVDARVFTSRWRQPGDQTFFKGITDLSITQATTRFVEKWSELTMANINVSYDLDRLAAIKRANIRRLRASFVMDTPFVLSTVGMERGTAYPFARTFSFTLQTNF